MREVDEKTGEATGREIVQPKNIGKKLKFEEPIQNLRFKAVPNQ